MYMLSRNYQDLFWKHFTFYYFEVFVVGPLADGDWLCLRYSITEVHPLHNSAMLSTRLVTVSTVKCFQKKTDKFEKNVRRQMMKIFTQISQARPKENAVLYDEPQSNEFTATAKPIFTIPPSVTSWGCGVPVRHGCRSICRLCCLWSTKATIIGHPALHNKTLSSTSLKWLHCKTKVTVKFD